MQSKCQTGVAIIAVLWLLAILTLLATTITTMSVNQRRAVEVLIQAAKDEGAIDSAIRVALYQMLNTKQDIAVDVIGRRQVEVFGDVVTVSIELEAGRVDLNTAPSDLLAAVFASNGWSASEARARSLSIVSWRGDGGAGFRAEGGVAARNGPLETVNEVLQIPGFKEVDPLILDAFTVYSHAEVPLRSAAPPSVLRALAWLEELQAAGGATGEQESDRHIPESKNLPRLILGEILRISGCVTRNTHETCRVAIARLTGKIDEPYQVFWWGRDQILR